MLGTKIVKDIFEQEPALVGNEVDDGEVEVGSVQPPKKFLVLEDHLRFNTRGILMIDHCDDSDCYDNDIDEPCVCKRMMVMKITLMTKRHLRWM